MKILIGVVIALVVLVALFLITPAFIDPNVYIERSIEINTPAERVFNTVKNYDLYAKWSPFLAMEKDASYSTSGTPGEIGSTWTWKGDSIGAGSLTIESYEPYKSIREKVVFTAPMQSQALDLWSFKSVDSTHTKVTWGYEATTDSYIMRYFNLGVEKMLGPLFEQGLSSLKNLVENMPAENIMEPQSEAQMN